MTQTTGFKHSRRSAAALLALAGALVVAGGSAFAQAKERTVKFATQNPKGHPMVIGMEKFAELLEKSSGGKIKVKLFPGGVLGGDQQNVSALQGGTLDMMTLNAGILSAQVKEFAVFDLPFLFSSPTQVDAVVDGPWGRAMLDKLDAKNMHGLAFWELGFRQITNSKRAINKVEDLAGLKLRVIPQPVNIDWVSALGANPTPLAFPEVYAALEQRAIDAQENPVTVIEINKFYEVQKFLVMTNHQYNPQAVIVSKKLWDSLSADEKKMFSDAAVGATTEQRKASREQAGSALANLKKAGMTVTELPPAEMQKLRDKLKPVIDKHGAAIPATVAELQAELARIRAAK